MSKKSDTGVYTGRYAFVLVALGMAMSTLVARAVDLHVFDRDFLQNQGEARHLRVVAVPAHRGMITDRNGEPFAISTPVESVWANPRELAEERARWPELARVLGIDVRELSALLDGRSGREFAYLRRHVEPSVADRVRGLKLPGVALQKEYRRYYPSGEVAAHVVGFTNVDDTGQEGLELQYDPVLRGQPGSKRVIKDRLGRIVENVDSIREPRPGQDVALSLDRRLQYLAYRELKAAVQRHQAKGGSAVLLDARSGEVLAMVNQPAYNPNNRNDLESRRYRNRAVTDMFEPGSTIKPFTIAAALESGRFRPETLVDTSPGVHRLAGFTIRDLRNYGVIDVATVIQKSSNVGASRIALSLEPKQLWTVLSGVGFGLPTGSGFPGEAGGQLADWHAWRDVRRATLAYGYGLSVTPLQLAHAYAVLANDGAFLPVTFLRQPEGERSTGDPIMKAETARALREMLEAVVAPGGTATAARIPGYRIAGKTGTAHKANSGGYSEDRYVAVFAGLAPASRPRLVMMVMIDEPSAGEYYGGQVAAPVFQRVMEGALRLLDIPPDELRSLGNTTLARREGGA